MYLADRDDGLVVGVRGGAADLVAHHLRQLWHLTREASQLARTLIVGVFHRVATIIASAASLWSSRGGAEGAGGQLATGVGVGRGAHLEGAAAADVLIQLGCKRHRHRSSNIRD